MSSCDPHCPKRREFLRDTLGAATAVALAGTAASLLAACGSTPGASPSGTAIANQPSNVYSFPFATYSELSSAGGSRSFIVSATSGTKNVHVTRVSAGSAVTVNQTCTHAGCFVGSYNSGTQKYTCPCHSSVFNSDGSVNTGPATLALTTYSSTITGSGIDVTIP